MEGLQQRLEEAERDKRQTSELHSSNTSKVCRFFLCHPLSSEKVGQQLLCILSVSRSSRKKVARVKRQGTNKLKFYGVFFVSLVSLFVGIFNLESSLPPP